MGLTLSHLVLRRRQNWHAAKARLREANPSVGAGCLRLIGRGAAMLTRDVRDGRKDGDVRGEVVNCVEPSTSRAGDGRNFDDCVITLAFATHLTLHIHHMVHNTLGYKPLTMALQHRLMDCVTVGNCKRCST